MGTNGRRVMGKTLLKKQKSQNFYFGQPGSIKHMSVLYMGAGGKELAGAGFDVFVNLSAM